MEYPEAPTRGRKTGMLNRLFYGGPPIEELHERYAKKGRIDEEAPVKASREVRIEAPVGRVWELLNDPCGWGTWHSDIHDVRLDSGVEADARFAWANGKARMKSRFAIVEAGREITWTGVSSGAKAVHRHILEPTDDGGATLLFCEESIAGPLLGLFYSSARLRADMEKWMSALKSVARIPDETGGLRLGGGGPVRHRPSRPRGRFRLPGRRQRYPGAPLTSRANRCGR